MIIFKTTRVIKLVIAIPGRDFGIIMLGGLILLGLVMLGQQTTILAPLRLLFGLVYVCYVPGYCLTAALFPRRNDLSEIERLGLNLGLSIATVPVLAVVLDQSPWGLELWPIMMSEISFTGLCMLVAIGRRIRTEDDQVYAPELRWYPRRWWKSLPTFEQRLYQLVAGTLLVAGLCATWILLVPSSDANMTEFYMLGENGRAEDYPRQAAPGQTLMVTAGIDNQERTSGQYRIEVWASDRWNPAQRTMVQTAGPITLAAGQGQRMPVSWNTPALGSDQSIELLLYRDADLQPYRRLQLWVNLQPQP